MHDQCKKMPRWKPRAASWRRFSIGKSSERYKALRNASSNFTKRWDVRSYIFGTYGRRCYLCGSEENLQIDHLNSIWRCIYGNYPISQLNTEENLRPVCSRCNAGKAP